MSKVNNFINSVLKTLDGVGANSRLTDFTPTQLKSNSPPINRQAIDRLTAQFQDDKKPKPASNNQTRYPAYELSLVLPPGKKAIPYGALEINVIKHVFKRQGINISNGAAEAVAEKVKLDFSPKWDAARQKYVYNDKDGLYYRDSSFGKNSDMVLAGKSRNANGIEFNGYKFPISSDLQASILAEKDFAAEVTKNGGKAFLEKTFNERFGMTLDKALAELPADIRGKLKQIDAKTLLSAVMVGGAAMAALNKLPSKAVAVVAAGLTLKDVIQYGAEANHIADRIGQSTKASDLPVEELKTLITNGGLDILLAGVGYAGGKLAPKFIKLGDEALKLTDDVARKFDDAYRATKGKAAEWANKVDDALAPGMVTPEGITIKPPKVNTAKGSNVLEMRAGKTTSGNRQFEEAMRAQHLPKETVKVIDGDKMTQAAKITNRPAADQIAFVKNGKNFDAVITEITQGNKGLTHLKDQLEGGRMIAQADKELGLKTINFKYRVITDNQDLVRAIKANGGKVGRFPVTVINEGGRK